MGSGSRLQFYPLGLGGDWCFSLGLSLSSFPFALTVSVNFMFWGMSLGLGRAYDAPRQD